MNTTLNSIILVLAVAFLFAAAALSWNAIRKIVEERQKMSRRLEGSSGGDNAGMTAPSVAIEDNVLRRFSRFVTPGSEEELSVSRQRLARAGFRRPSAVRVFHLARAMSAIVFGFSGLLAFLLLGTDYPMPIRLVAVVVLLAFGFLFPSILLDRRIAKRKNEAEAGFPEALDLLLVCIEAGQSFDQAARRLARELSGHNTVLSEELTIVNEQLWAGKDRNVVFREFAQRLDVNDITAFITVLRQADQFGVSIGEAVRVYASDMRFKRVMRAEEKANTMPLKIALGSILFTVPPTIMIMIAPSILNIAQSFKPG
jgi:tight adherence protein C